MYIHALGYGGMLQAPTLLHVVVAVVAQTSFLANGDENRITFAENAGRRLFVVFPANGKTPAAVAVHFGAFAIPTSTFTDGDIII